VIETFAEFQAVIRDTVFSNAPADMRFCFDLINCDDASANAAGPLLKQGEDFFVFQHDIDRVRRTGVSAMADRRVDAELQITLYTKDKSDPLGCARRLEEVGAWFADNTISRVRFRTYQPTGSGPFMGFLAHDAFIPCDFELKRMR
jgi:hypothetical protein